MHARPADLAGLAANSCNLLIKVMMPYMLRILRLYSQAGGGGTPVASSGHRTMRPHPPPCSPAAARRATRPRAQHAAANARWRFRVASTSASAAVRQTRVGRRACQGAACRQAPATTTPAANTTLLAVWTSRAVVSQHVPRARAVVRGPRGVAGSVRGGAGACGCVAALAHLRHRSAESRIVARKTAWSHHRGLTAAAAPMLDIFHFSMTQDTSSAPVRPHCASGARGSAPLGGAGCAGGPLLSGVH
jgi:hypothetical protein